MARSNMTRPSSTIHHLYVEGKTSHSHVRGMDGTNKFDKVVQTPLQLPPYHLIASVERPVGVGHVRIDRLLLIL